MGKKDKKTYEYYKRLLTVAYKNEILSHDDNSKKIEPYQNEC